MWVVLLSTMFCNSLRHELTTDQPNVCIRNFFNQSECSSNNWNYLFFTFFSYIYYLDNIIIILIVIIRRRLILRFIIIIIIWIETFSNTGMFRPVMIIMSQLLPEACWDKTLPRVISCFKQCCNPNTSHDVRYLQRILSSRKIPGNSTMFAKHKGENFELLLVIFFSFHPPVGTSGFLPAISSRFSYRKVR